MSNPQYLSNVNNLYLVYASNIDSKVNITDSIQNTHKFTIQLNCNQNM